MCKCTIIFGYVYTYEFAAVDANFTHDFVKNLHMQCIYLIT